MRQVRAAWLTAFALLLAGCASVDELRHSQPVGEWNSASSAAEVSSCIRDAWASDRIGLEANGAAESRRGDSYIVVSPASGVPSEVAEIAPGGKGSRATLFSQAAINVGDRRERRSRAVERCAL